MKKVSCILIAIMLFSNFLFAQQLQKANWYFGNRAGVSFVSGSPVGVDNGVLSATEGCTAISDELGNLLFYSDGRTVYDSSHNLMQNGFALLGHDSSAQSSIVLPVPDDCNKYYLFTIDWAGGAGLAGLRGLYYNVVDMSLNNGLGAVVADQKNIPLPLDDEQKGYERLTAVVNANKDGYWILTHYGTKFYSFEVTENGVNLTPVISNHSFATFNEEAGQVGIGMLKASSDGAKLAISRTNIGTVYGGVAVYNFDSATGIVSNEQIIYPHDSNKHVYGIQFSPDNNLLYTYGGSKIRQYNLSASSIIDSEYEFTPIPGDAPLHGALELGLDGKIYFPNRYYLGSIENPNELYNEDTGVGPTSNHQAVPLVGQIAQARLGLPQFLNFYFRIAITVNDLKISEEQLYCSETILNFNFCHQGGQIDSIHWDFGDGTNSTEMYPQHSYTEIGTYTITLSLEVDGETVIRTFSILINEGPEILDAAQTVCKNSEGIYSFDLNESLSDINPSNRDYEISFHETEIEAESGTNALGSTYTTVETTTLWIRAKDKSGCYVIKQLELIVFEGEYSIKKSEVNCSGSSVVIEIETEQDIIINWFETETSITPIFSGFSFETPILSQTTTYWIEVLNQEACISTRKPIQIVVVSPPDVFLQDDYNVICKGDSKVISAIATQESNIYWFDEVNAEDWIATGNEFVTPNLTENKTYWVQSYNSNTNCYSDKKQLVVEVIPITENVIDFTYADVTCENSNQIMFPIFTENSTQQGYFESEPEGLYIDSQSGVINPLLSKSGTYVITYRLPEDEFMCVSTREKSYIFSMDLCIPKGISPNGDGKNDALDLSAFAPLSVEIFNRYGKRVYIYHEGYVNQWHGQDINGNQLPDGTYFYNIKTLDKEYSGYIYLMGVAK